MGITNLYAGASGSGSIILKYINFHRLHGHFDIANKIRANTGRFQNSIIPQQICNFIIFYRLLI